MNKQHNNKIVTDRYIYIKEKKLLCDTVTSLSFYVMKISYDLFLFSYFKHLIFVEWAIEI